MKTILIVEAVASHRELLVQWLKDDYTVITTTEGAAGITLAERIEPELIFMALALPDIAGAEAIRRLKAQARLRDTPLIALTTPAVSGEDTTARAIGCADVLRTPLEEESVSAILRKWLGGS